MNVGTYDHNLIIEYNATGSIWYAGTVFENDRKLGSDETIIIPIDGFDTEFKLKKEIKKKIRKPDIGSKNNPKEVDELL